MPGQLPTGPGHEVAPEAASTGGTANAGAARGRRALQVLVLAAVGAVAIAMYGSFGRPIWIDEFVHFALGSHRSVGEAWDTIHETTVTTSHGQTGAYMLLDYLLLRGFGASALALRLPSLACGALLLVAAVAVLRARGFGFGWQLLVLVAFLGQSNLMYFVGEARPYIPLAAAAVGTLAYYLARSRGPLGPGMRALGIGSILLGAAMHPYFSLYWAALFLFAHAVALGEGRMPAGWRSLVHHVDVPLSVAGVAIYFALGAATWLRGGPAFTFDPYEWIRSDGLLRVFLGIAHLQFAGVTGSDVAAPIGVLAIVVAAPVALSLRSRWRSLAGPLLAPAALLLLALGISLLLWWLSYRRSYWVLPRQWVASMALAPVAVAWWLAEAARLAARRAPRLGAAVLATAFLLLSRRAYDPVLVRTPPRTSVRQLATRLVSGPRSPTPRIAAETRNAPADNDGWVALANENIEAGGAVWDVFRKYYGKGTPGDVGR